jgi:ketosteroid isomerase-like protein
VSQENVDLHRRAYAIFNAHDLEAFVALFDPESEFRSAFAAVGGVTVYRGQEGLREWWQGQRDVWGDELRMEVEAYFDLGEQTLAFSVLHARGRQSGTQTTMQLAQLARWPPRVL